MFSFSSFRDNQRCCVDRGGSESTDPGYLLAYQDPAHVISLVMNDGHCYLNVYPGRRVCGEAAESTNQYTRNVTTAPSFPRASQYRQNKF